MAISRMAYPLVGGKGHEVETIRMRPGFLFPGSAVPCRSACPISAILAMPAHPVCAAAGRAAGCRLASESGFSTASNSTVPVHHVIANPIGSAAKKTPGPAVPAGNTEEHSSANPWSVIPWSR